MFLKRLTCMYVPTINVLQVWVTNLWKGAHQWEYFAILLERVCCSWMHIYTYMYLDLTFYWFESATFSCVVSDFESCAACSFPRNNWKSTIRVSRDWIRTTSVPRTRNNNNNNNNQHHGAKRSNDNNTQHTERTRHYRPTSNPSNSSITIILMHLN